MEKKFEKMLAGYDVFRKKYAYGDESMMRQLSEKGQQPEVMVVACSDSRVDPALLLQCEPGDLFTVRNVANIIPPCEIDDKHHGTSAALEFGVCGLKVKHLIILGHSQCGGMHALLDENILEQNDFVSNWAGVTELNPDQDENVNALAKRSLVRSYENCLSFPWLVSRVDEGDLKIHLWFLNLHSGDIDTYNFNSRKYVPLAPQ